MHALLPISPPAFVSRLRVETASFRLHPSADFSFPLSFHLGAFWSVFLRFFSPMSFLFCSFSCLYSADVSVWSSGAALFSQAFSPNDIPQSWASSTKQSSQTLQPPRGPQRCLFLFVWVTVPATYVSCLGILPHRLYKIRVVFFFPLLSSFHGMLYHHTAGRPTHSLSVLRAAPHEFTNHTAIFKFKERASIKHFNW